jgi:hypothetical protein
MEAMPHEQTIYRAENLAISNRKILAGQTTFATDAIQTVWIGKYSSMAPLAIVLGLLLLLFGGTMISCTGLFIGALSGSNLDDWTTKSYVAIACGVALLVFAKRFPPFYYVVHATIAGQRAGVYRTSDLAQAREIEQAITVARGL